ncbi:MAG TPA: nitroreductase family deazaflavin-dependent oxidoreductase [Candidatus Limnocylindrales bacterium]|nr:nitroreductase family deazaflavin-dependent oxidoreductase [Candidatus Limnocylindrales bacterium]
MSTAPDEDVTEALKRGEVMDITTIGRKSGEPRRIELVYHNVDGHILISGHPGRPRSWLANLAANPRFTFHLKRSVQADLTATARVITDTAERERFLKPISAGWRIDHALMVGSAPLVEVTFD